MKFFRDLRVNGYLVGVSLILMSYCALGEDMSSFLGRATAVVVVEVSSGTDALKSQIGNGCGLVYSGYVLDNILSSHDGEEVSFRSHSALTIGGTYLVFLTDSVDQEADESSTLTGLRSAACAETGLINTVMKIAEIDDRDFGPEALLERRRDPTGDANRYHLNEYVLFGNRAFHKLIVDSTEAGTEMLEARHYDLERAEFIERGVLYDRTSLIDFVRRCGDRSD